MPVWSGRLTCRPTVTMPGAELGTVHPGRPGWGGGGRCSLACTSQTFMGNHSVPGTVLATRDTEMNRTHCPLILAPLRPPFSLLGPVPEPCTEGDTKDRTNCAWEGMAWGLGNQNTWAHVHHSQATCHWALSDLSFPTGA